MQISPTPLWYRAFLLTKICYSYSMIIIKKDSYSKEEITKLKEMFDVYIKTVFDVKQGICCAGCDRHFECEQMLLKQGSKQDDLWGGGIDLETNVIDFNSMINIRPAQGNRSNEIQDEKIRDEYEKLTKQFFKGVL